MLELISPILLYIISAKHTSILSASHELKFDCVLKNLVVFPCFIGAVGITFGLYCLSGMELQIMPLDP